MPRKYPQIVDGFRSGLERTNAEVLEKTGMGYDYEPWSLPYSRPERPSRYTPDFVLDNGIIIETKGRFTAADRAKHLLLKQQYPDMDVRFVFSNSKQRLSKKSRSTYADWCRKHGFQFADKVIPEEWLK